MKYCKCKAPNPDGQHSRDDLGDLHFYCLRCNLEIEPDDVKTLRILRTQLKIAVEGLEIVTDAEWNAEAMYNAQKKAEIALVDIKAVK